VYTACVLKGALRFLINLLIKKIYFKNRKNKKYLKIWDNYVNGLILYLS
jgi:hypothetical protein